MCLTINSRCHAKKNPGVNRDFKDGEVLLVHNFNALGLHLAGEMQSHKVDTGGP